MQIVGSKSQSEQLDEIIDKMGIASSKAQGLPSIITTSQRMFASGDNRLYFKVDTSVKNKVIGLIKVGKRKLFIHRHDGKMSEITPLCVLDFYVHESV